MNKLETIIEAIQDVTGYDVTQNNRRAKTIELRCLYYHIARQKTDYSLRDIGGLVNRNHATVVHGLKMYENQLRGCLFDIRLEVLARIDSQNEYKDLLDVHKQNKELKELIKDLQKKVYNQERFNPFLKIPLEKRDLFVETRLKPFLRMNS